MEFEKVILSTDMRSENSWYGVGNKNQLHLKISYDALVNEILFCIIDVHSLQLTWIRSSVDSYEFISWILTGVDLYS